jgi:hypothetical protein
VTRLTYGAGLDNLDPAWRPFPAIHVGNLSAVASSDRSTWSATVEIAVHDAAHNPLNGATVTGAWNSDGPSGSCTTADAGNGTCVVRSSDQKQNVPFVTFTVTSVTNVGGIFTHGDPATPASDRTFGEDFRLFSSRFLGRIGTSALTGSCSGRAVTGRRRRAVHSVLARAIRTIGGIFLDPRKR